MLQRPGIQGVTGYASGPRTDAGGVTDRQVFEQGLHQTDMLGRKRRLRLVRPGRRRVQNQHELALGAMRIRLQPVRRLRQGHSMDLLETLAQLARKGQRPSGIANGRQRVDTRMQGATSYRRQLLTWPVSISEAERRPKVTH